MIKLIMSSIQMREVEALLLAEILNKNIKYYGSKEL